jgi:TRAP-type C4-dicarboxylate transport system permease small subunit
MTSRIYHGSICLLYFDAEGLEGRQAMSNMDSLRKTVHFLSRTLNCVSMCALVAMMVLVCANVVMRPLGRPIMGTFEIVEFLTCVAVAFALPFTTSIHRHIAIDLLTHRLSKRSQARAEKIVTMLSMGIFSLLTWQLFVYAKDLSRTGTVSPTLRIPLFPIVYATGFCCAMVCLVLLTNFFKSSARGDEK